MKILEAPVKKAEIKKPLKATAPKAVVEEPKKKTITPVKEKPAVKEEIKKNPAQGRAKAERDIEAQRRTKSRSKTC